MHCFRNLSSGLSLFGSRRPVFQMMEINQGMDEGARGLDNWVKENNAETEADFWKKNVEIGSDISTKDTPTAVADVQRLYGPDAYAKVLKDRVDKLMPDSKLLGIRDGLVQRLTKNYKREFEGAGGILPSFQEAIGKLDAQRSRAIGLIKEQTWGTLNALKAQVGTLREAQKAEPGNFPKMRYADKPWEAKIPILHPILDSVNIPILSRTLHGRETVEYKQAQEKIQKQFEGWIDKVFEAYMTPELYDSKLGEQMRVGIRMKMEDQISALFSEGKATPETLQALVKSTLAQLQAYGSLDKDPGKLSVADATEIANEAALVVDQNFINLINTGQYKDVIDELEKRRVINPESWNKALTATANELIADVGRNGNEKAFIQKVNEKSKEPAKDVGEAARYFKAELALRGQAGVREALDMLEDFNRTLNERRVSATENLGPESMKGMIVGERERLLGVSDNGQTIPPSDGDKAVVDFMRKNERADREAVLRNPNDRQKLFRGIQTILRDYQPYYQEQSRNLPKKAHDLRTNKDALNKRPTGHDELARIGALITLASEAQWVVENYGFKTQLEAAQQPRRTDKAVFEPNMNFIDTNATYSTRYQSVMERSGITGKEFGLTLAKLILGGMAFANIKNSWKGLDHLDETIESAVTNPLIYASVGTIYGINRYREDPSVAQIPFVSPGRRAEILNREGLYSLSRTSGRDNVKRYVETEPEWTAMDHLEPNEVKSLLAKIQKRKSPWNKVVLKEDLRGMIKDDVTWANLPDDPKSPDEDHTLIEERFLFYSKFLTSDTTNLEQLHENCLNWV